MFVMSYVRNMRQVLTVLVSKDKKPTRTGGIYGSCMRSKGASQNVTFYVSVGPQTRVDPV